MTVPFFKSLIMYSRDCFPGSITQRAEAEVKMCKPVGILWKRNAVGSSS